MQFIDYIQHHPAIALGVTVAHILFAEWLRAVEIPLIIMQLAQLGAWAVTMTVGIITIYGFLKKRHGRKG